MTASADPVGWETGRWPSAPSYRAHPRLYPLRLADHERESRIMAFSGRAYNGRGLGPVRRRRHMPGRRETPPGQNIAEAITPAALIIFRLLDSLRRHSRVEVHASGTIEETPVMHFYSTRPDSSGGDEWPPWWEAAKPSRCRSIPGVAQSP